MNTNLKITNKIVKLTNIIHFKVHVIVLLQLIQVIVTIILTTLEV